ncbi:MAG: hypothetical protein IT435_14735 [Phycisphaerales bacterium]|nr:hypothetical protein [Phycisphaerales bacterium]
MMVQVFIDVCPDREAEGLAARTVLGPQSGVHQRRTMTVEYITGCCNRRSSISGSPCGVGRTNELFHLCRLGQEDGRAKALSGMYKKNAAIRQ